MPKEYVSRTVPETQQGFSWQAPVGALGELVAGARQRARNLLAQKRDIELGAAAAATPPRFGAALSGDHVAVIAELKRRSPSRGDIQPGLDAAARARAYEAGGAAAISVLTEGTRFGGSAADLSAVRSAVALPILRKDFHVDEIQLLEARALGASAVLLIARAVPPRKLRELFDVATGLGLQCLIEVRDESELDAALEAGARIIGVNTRNLETLEMDDDLAARLIQLIPARVTGVAESGIQSRADVVHAAAAGADAVLVGSALSVATDPVAAVRALAGVLKVRRLESRSA